MTTATAAAAAATTTTTTAVAFPDLNKWQPYSTQNQHLADTDENREQQGIDGINANYNKDNGCGDVSAAGDRFLIAFVSMWCRSGDVLTRTRTTTRRRQVPRRTTGTAVEVFRFFIVLCKYRYLGAMHV